MCQRARRRRRSRRRRTSSQRSVSGSVTASAELVHKGRQTIVAADRHDRRRRTARHAHLADPGRDRGYTRKVLATACGKRRQHLHSRRARPRPRARARRGADRGRARAEAERLVRKEIALAQIRQYGDPVLRMRAEEVETFDDELRSDRADDRPDARSRRRRARGDAGRHPAALLRLHVDEEDRVLVNPVVTPVGSETESTRRDACRSGPVRVPVERPYEVEGRGARRRRATPSRSSSRGSRPGSSSTSSTTSTAS